jgi:hypothetical protein
VPYYNKEQTPLGDLFDPNPRFHGGCFGVWGTPPAKPLNGKNWFLIPGAAIDDSRAQPVRGQPKLACRDFATAPRDIIYMSRFYCSLSIKPFIVAVCFTAASWKTKNPASFSASRVRKSNFGSSTCLPPLYPNCLRVESFYGQWTN